MPEKLACAVQSTRLFDYLALPSMDVLIQNAPSCFVQNIQNPEYPKELPCFTNETQQLCNIESWWWWWPWWWLTTTNKDDDNYDELAIYLQRSQHWSIDSVAFFYADQSRPVESKFHWGTINSRRRRKSASLAWTRSTVLAKSNVNKNKQTNKKPNSAGFMTILYNTIWLPQKKVRKVQLCLWKHCGRNGCGEKSPQKQQQ